MFHQEASVGTIKLMVEECRDPQCTHSNRRDFVRKINEKVDEWLRKEMERKAKSQAHGPR